MKSAAARGIPLGIAIYSNSSSTPVLELKATSISYGAVSSHVFSIKAPAGAHVVSIGSLGSGAGATGAMRVWSGIFSRLPSAPLKVSGKGLDWQWVQGGASTDPGCPDARQFAFVAGFAPPYQSCTYADPYYQQQEGEDATEDSGGGGWRSWFGFGNRGERDEPSRNAPAPQPASPAPAPAPAPTRP